MKYILCLLFFISIKSCRSESPPTSNTSSNEIARGDKISLDNYLIDSVDQKRIGEKIQEQEKIKQLKTALKISLDRGTERPYMWDVFVASNSDLLQFYHYKNFLINSLTLKSYYIKIDYEDGNYQAILLINENSENEYNNLLLYEELDSEEKYFRYTEIKDDKIQVIFKSPNSSQNLSFQVKNGVFLDYFERESEIIDKKSGKIDEKWRNNGKMNVLEYELKGQTNNHLKDGYWIEKKYSMEYNENIIEDGNYINGIKTGEWNYSVEGPVDMIKTYDNGKHIKFSYP